jgi:hypothetical protein
MSITKFSRAFWETAVKYKGSKPEVLRDYDILKDREKGKTLAQCAIKHNLTRKTVAEIQKKYR